MRKLRNAPFTLLIHLALAIIAAGATVTFFTGIQGTVTLAEGATPVTSFDKTSGPGDGRLPFPLSLERPKSSAIRAPPHRWTSAPACAPAARKSQWP